MGLAGLYWRGDLFRPDTKKSPWSSIKWRMNILETFKISKHSNCILPANQYEFFDISLLMMTVMHRWKVFRITAVWIFINNKGNVNQNSSKCTILKSFQFFCTIRLSLNHHLDPTTSLLLESNMHFFVQNHHHETLGACYNQKPGMSRNKVYF